MADTRSSALRNILTAGVIVVGLGWLAKLIATSASSSSSSTAPLSSTALLVTPRPNALPFVELDGSYFVRDVPSANGSGAAAKRERFLPLGAHWVPAKAAMHWPIAWDPADIEADFAKMHDLGYTLARFDMLWAFFEPRAGEYNAEAFRQLDVLISLAHKYKIYLNPSLFIGGEVGEAYWDVPWRNGRNPHTDPEMLRLETRHAAELGRRYANESAIIAWDLTDEPPFWITTGLTDAQAIQWTHAIAGGIRQYDKRHPIVIGTSGQEVSHGPFRADNLAREAVSFFSVHPFTIYKPELYPDAMLSERSTYGAAFEIALSSSAGRPAMVHEMGASTAQYSPERVALYERTNLYAAIAAGSIGIDLWCFTDTAPEQHKKLPYLRTPQETEWGMVTWDRNDKPRGREFRQFTRVMRQLDLTDMTPAPAEAALVIPEEWSKSVGDVVPVNDAGANANANADAKADAQLPYVSTEDTVNANTASSAIAAKLDGANTWLMGSLLSSFILGRHAGMKADFPREQNVQNVHNVASWTKHRIVMLPSPLTSTSTPFLTHVHTDFYAQAKTYVEAGGFLYASVAADAAIPDMTSIFGARLADTNTATAVTIRVIKAYGTSLKVGDTFQLAIPATNARSWGSLLELGTGDVIAVDQDNHPVLVANTLGQGKTLLFAFPIESHLAVTPSAFEKGVDTKRVDFADALYRAIRDVSGVDPDFVSNFPSVEVTTLRKPNRDRGYAFVINHSSQSKKVVLGASSTASEERSLTLLTPEGGQPLSTPEFTLDAYDAKVVEWR